MAGAYSSSKAAVIGITKAIGKDVAEHRHPRQLHRAGGDQHADPRPDLAGAHRLHDRAHTARARRRAARGRRTHLLARERGDELLHRSVLRHLRRPGDVLIGFVRVQTERGPRVGRWDGETVEVLDHDDPLAALRRRRNTRTACRARHARADPRTGDLVRRRHVRAQPRRAARGGEDRRARRLRARLRRRPPRALHEGREHGAHRRPRRLDPVAQRLDAGWCRSPSSPSCSERAATPVAVTIGNDVSSRDIEGANPLYIPQAKIFAGACAIGPALAVPDDWDAPFPIRMRILDAEGGELFAGETSTARMKRSPRELAAWVMRDNPVPPGSRPADGHRARAAGRLHARARPHGRDRDRGHRRARQHGCRVSGTVPA